MGAKRTIVVVGGALSGPAAAARARETDEAARIVMLERAEAVSYAIAGIAYHVSREVSQLDDLNRQRTEFFRDVYDIEARTGIEVSRIDARAHVVVTASESFRYDALVWATGAGSVIPAISGLDGAKNVHLFRNLRHLRELLVTLRRAKRVAVLGGGFFGVEAADALARRGLETVLVGNRTRLLPTFAPAASEAARRGLEALGVTVMTSANVSSATRRGDRVRALVVDGTGEVACDAVVLAAGVYPRTELLRDAGVRLLENGAVRVDAHCRTSLPDLYACGSCVALPHVIDPRPLWLPQAAIADKTAQVAGENAAGGHARMGPVLGTAIVRAGAVTVARTGLEHEALDHADVARVHVASHDPYFPGAKPVSIELAYEPESGRILAADVYGEVGVDKRVDVIATAMAGRLGVHELAHLDLAYAPPFGSARDPVNVAGTVAERTLRGANLAWGPRELAERLENLVLVDVRSKDERARGVIPTSRPMSLADVREQAQALAASDGTVVFVSTDGSRGYLAARIARAHGVSDAGYLSGGTTSWVAEGLLLMPPPREAAPSQPARKPSKQKQNPRRAIPHKPTRANAAPRTRA